MDIGGSEATARTILVFAVQDDLFKGSRRGSAATNVCRYSLLSFYGVPLQVPGTQSAGGQL